jgi:hypothetical protein
LGLRGHGRSQWSLGPDREEALHRGFPEGVSLVLYEGPQGLGAYMRKEDLHFVPRLSSTTLRELIAQLQDAQAPTAKGP